MKYNDFKKARKFGKDEANKSLLKKMSDCEDLLGICEWLRSNENRDKDGKPLYKASITLNIHGRGEEDSSENGVRSVSYETNFDFVEKKARTMYESLIKEFENKTGEE